MRASNFYGIMDGVSIARDAILRHNIKMRIEQLKLHDNEENVYVFNPSIAQVHNDVFLMTYRVIRYGYDIPVHPWVAWFGKVSNNGERHPMKYRGPGPALTVSFEATNKLPEVPEGVFEFDGTAAALVRIDNDGVKPIRFMSNLFDNELNVDTRIVPWGPTGSPSSQGRPSFRVTYNAFVDSCPKRLPQMLMRDLDISGNGIKLSEERHCCDDYLEKYGETMEKNWAYVVRPAEMGTLFLYKLGPKATFLHDTGHTFTTPCPAIGRIMNQFGKDILFSLGTPVIRWKKRYLTAIHVKVHHNLPAKSDNLARFLERNKRPDLCMHKHFVYLMCLLTIDDDFEVTSMSHAFIPTGNGDHLPYTLVFPTGIHAFPDDSVVVSYGEGDERCKFLTLSCAETESLLHDCGGIHADTFDFLMLQAV